MTISKTEAKARIRSVVMDCFRNHGWDDRDDFTLRVVDALFEMASEGRLNEGELFSRMATIRTNFFTTNSASRRMVASTLYSEAGRVVGDTMKGSLQELTLGQIFPEVNRARRKPQRSTEVLDIPERVIQDALRVILRNRRAAPIPNRDHDSSLEVADIEHFEMNVFGRKCSFAIVVKGYRSISGKKLTWEDVAHQITKAFRTKPGQIILVTAKEPVDGFVTQAREYGESVGNPNLVLLMLPEDLLRVLTANKIV